MAYEQQAKAAGDARFAGEERSILTQQQLAAIKAQQDQAALNQWGLTGRTAIDQSFDGLLADMSRNREAARGNINASVNAIGQGYDDAARGNQLFRDESRAYIERLMGNYGIGNDAVAQIQNPMEELTNKLVERNTRYGQDARAALTDWGTKHNVLYGDAETNAQGARAFQQSAFQSQLGNLLAEAQNSQRQREIEFASALQGLAAQRGGFEVEYAQGLADRDSDRNLKLAEMQMRANLEQAQMDAAASRFNAENSYRGQDNAWEKEKFYASLGLDRDKFDFEKWQAMQDPSTTDYSGISGMRKYAQDVGNPGVFNQANQYIDAASRTPGAIENPDSIGQIASGMVRQPKPQYGRIGGSSGVGEWEKPYLWEDIINAIAIGTGRY